MRSALPSIALALLAGLFAGLWLGERGRRITSPTTASTTSTVAVTPTTSPTVVLPPRASAREPRPATQPSRTVPTRLGRLVPTPRPDAALHTWLDRTARMRIVVTDRRGGERVRVADVFDARLDDGDSRSVMFFVDPPEVRGTAFLAFFRLGTTSEQWLYLPELQRVREVGLSMRGTTWMGTDFTFGDVALLAALQAGLPLATSVEELGDTTLDDVPATILSLAGLAEELRYSRLNVWFGVDDGLLRRVDCLADGHDLAKQFTQGDVRLVDGIAVAHHGEMRSLPGGSRTVVDLSDVRIDRGLPDDLFTPSRLGAGAP